MTNRQISTRVLRLFVGVLSAHCVVACSSVEGYPASPENNAATLVSLQSKYFTPTSQDAYDAATSEDARKKIRDDIVYSRMRAYDIEFSEFQRALNSNSNTINIGTDVTAIALGVVGATVGSASAKSVLAAASAGVIGIQGAVNKDLYYQKTIAALIAQMEANREEAKLSILTNLKQPDSVYPLQRANLDLSTLNDAGSLPSAISSITEKSNAAKAKAQAAVQGTVATYSNSPSTVKLIAWLNPGGTVSRNRMDKLRAWLSINYPTLNVPAPLILEDVAGANYEAVRTAALGDKVLMTWPK